MLATILRRLAVLPLMLLGVTLLTFVVTRVIPADPARVAAGLNAPAEQVERLRIDMGLHQPILVQYGSYIAHLVRGDWGMSAVSQRPVLPDILTALPATLEILLLATLGFILLGIPFGVFIGSTTSKAAGVVTSIVAYLGMAFPVFWLGLMLQIVFYRDLAWLPAVGRISSSVGIPPTVTGFYTIDAIIGGDLDAFVSAARHLVLPVMCLVLARFAVTARFVAAGMREALAADYSRTAVAKGASRLSVILRHALRNVLIPVNTMLGLQFGWLLAGSVLIESVFSWPGIGWYAWRSIVSLDFQPIIGVTIVFALAFVVVNLLTDLLYDVLDPRVATARDSA
jgi:ABC-type dipeptide/oligopeptide/nickel transport system permease component